jgi:hypothetical protein
MVEKRGRAVVLVLAIEEYERLKAIESKRSTKAPRSSEKKKRVPGASLAVKK